MIKCELKRKNNFDTKTIWYFDNNQNLTVIWNTIKHLQICEINKKRGPNVLWKFNSLPIDFGDFVC